MRRHVKALERIAGFPCCLPKRIVGWKFQAVHPLAQSVQEPKLPANNLRQFVGMLGLKIIGPHISSVGAMMSGANTKADDSMNGNQTQFSVR